MMVLAQQLNPEPWIKSPGVARLLQGLLHGCYIAVKRQQTVQPLSNSEIGSGTGTRTLNLAVNRSALPDQKKQAELAGCRWVPPNAMVCHRRCCTPGDLAQTSVPIPTHSLDARRWAPDVGRPRNYEQLRSRENTPARKRCCERTRCLYGSGA